MSTTVKRGYVDAGPGQIHYRSAGPAGGPPLVLLHQSPSSSVQFERAFPYLAAAGLRVFALDTPGFGLSDPPPGPPSIEDYAAAVVEALDALGLDAVHLAGHHTGATVAWEVAGAHPERVLSLTVSGAGLYTPEERRQWQQFVPEERLEVRPDGSHLMQVWERTGRMGRDTNLYLRQRSLVQFLLAGEVAWYGHNAAFNYDPEPRVRSVSVPILILTNTGDVIHEQALRTARLQPDARLVVLEGGSHDIVDEQPEAWTRALIEFVKEGPRGEA